ncbi:MAG: phosphate ABC transporter permease subunit PstC [Alphaproteobacteria bacterium]|nr:phosphate ABC transporter permease subunit PstC [Alphaproteobacteria bacterium]
MSPYFTATLLVLLMVFGHMVGRRRAYRSAGGDSRALHSLPQYYGFFVALWAGIPAAILMVVWLVLEPALLNHWVIASLGDSVRDLPRDRISLLLNDIRNIADGGIAASAGDPLVAEAAARLSQWRRLGDGALLVATLAVSAGGLTLAWRRIDPALRARVSVERIFNVFLLLASLIAIMTTVGIVLSLLFETWRFFGKVPVAEFLFGLTWSPQTALRADQVASAGAFGAVPLFAGTLLITAIAMIVAVPIGLMSAIYLSEYAPRPVRDILKPTLEILAGIPTVVYGFFAALTVAPFIREWGSVIGLDVASESALAAGLVMGIMIIPFVSSLSDDVINAVPQTLRDGSFALGATQSETVRQVIVPAAFPGIVGSVLLAISRAIGETMIVVMAAGLAANLTINPLEAVTTVTVQIVTLLVGDQEFDSAKTLAAFALGLALFCVTLALNVVALKTVRKYREKYD